VVVEVAGGTAIESVLRAALAAGKPVVTANTTLLAAKLDELGLLAQRTATPLYCEAAVAAALPIIRHLSHRADEVDSFAAILNGTANFVITRMEQEELSVVAATRRPSCRSSPTAPSASGCARALFASAASTGSAPRIATSPRRWAAGSG
jgi:homoserine dehydrogenase